MPADNNIPLKPSLKKSLEVYCNKQSYILFFLGFSAGLPIMLVFSSLSFWLREADISRSTIGFFSWVGLAYGLKWLWSPLVDRMPLPLLSRLLGRRRAWLLLSQLAIVVSLTGMALTDPVADLWTMALFAVLVAFSSATQDIVIDAYRIESAEQRQQAVLAAAYMVGYRLGVTLATAGVLAIAAWVSIDETVYDQSAWQSAYLVMAGFIGVGIITTLLIAEPEKPQSAPVEQRVQQWIARSRLPRPIVKITAWFYGAVICPFMDFILRYRWQALLILALISTYRISDFVVGVMANPFYVDMGYTKQEVASITKVIGIIMTLTGAALAGWLILRMGILRILLAAGILVAITNLMFAGLAVIGHNLMWLTVVISLDSIAAGMAAAAFIAYLSSLTNISYSATQYALFSSVMALFPKFIAGFSGIIVDEIGYALFFIASALMGVPTLLLILMARKYLPEPNSIQNAHEQKE